MRLVKAESGEAWVVRLPVVPLEPFPGVAGVAVITPMLGAVGVLGAEVGLFGWLDPFVLGGTPIAALLVPLAWLVARGREQHLELEVGASCTLHLGRRHVRLPEASPVGLGPDRLQLAGLDVHLLPLADSDRAALRAVLEGAGHPTHAVSARALS
ncbi:MAG: hypothetical protein KC656_00805 [Myxococcales bacterium]|nr:hypothetical protein [Myxococcales bacterium]MCB9668953.1 hypothetical protein [Alphaproteobacteria bacterium]MCB9691280.1 hypothetical protein [Alphaproteobacteria bacterium]